MTMLRRRRSMLGLLLIAPLALLSGCGDNGVATVRIIDVSPANPAIDAFVSDDQVATNVGYGTATSYTQVSADTHTVSLTVSGNDSSVIEMTEQDFLNLSNYTIFAVNPGSGLSQLFLLDSNSEPDTGDYKLRIVNVSPTAGVVDVYVTAPSTSITTVPATLRNLAYQTASAYLQLAASSYEVRFTTPGTKTVLADTAAVTPAVGDVDTVALADAPAGGAPLEAYQFVDAQFSNNTPVATVSARR